jgi:hypothetical protein
MQTIRENFMITGQVLLANSQPGAGLTITAFNKNLRSAIELGRAVTESDGTFTIPYVAEFGRAEHATADLLFRLNAPEGKEITGFSLFRVKGSRKTEIADPAILFNATANEKVEIVLQATATYRGPSEYEVIQTTIAPLLENVTPDQLSENAQLQDISFLAGETGITKQQLYRYVIAHRLTLQSKIEPECWYALFSAPVYVHLFASSRTTDPDELIRTMITTLTSVTPAELATILNKAIDNNVINSSWRNHIDTCVRLFTSFVAQRIGRPQEGDRKVLVQQVVGAAGISENTSTEFYRIYQNYAGPLPELWKQLREQKQLPEEDIDVLETTYQLSGLLNNNFSVAKAVRENFKLSTPTQLKTIARLDEQEWNTFISRQMASGAITIPEETIGDRPETKATSYAMTVRQQFKETFPTTAFHGGLERALQSGERPAIRNAEKLNSLLKEDPEFDLLTTPIDNYARQNTRNENLRRLFTDQAFREDLKSVQRVFKLAPDYAAANTLLRDDVHSAAGIYRMGKQSFIKRYEKQPGFNTKLAKATYNKAANTHAAVITLVGELKALEDAGAVQALNDNEEAVNTFPNWQNLFGKADICECEHCRSVYSPAAYFVDILMFLKNRTWGIPLPYQNVKDVLFARRPDLGYLELSCENANTPLPYIDVVNEVLETVVAAGEDDVELTGFTTMPANATQAKTEVTTAFQNLGITLPADFILSGVPGKDEYLVRTSTVTYLLKKKATANYFYEETRQTKVGAKELRAYPQYIKPAAYKKLSSAVYPLLLPFNLFTEEVALFLQKSGVQRWQLMQQLLGNAAPNNPTEAEIAAAYFTLSYKAGNPDPDEGSVLLTADATNQFKYWGETTIPALLNNLKKVDVFLQRTGLAYNDMLSMLDLTFINPGNSIYIEHKDASCDTNQKELRNLDENALDRIQRFIRLWKKLGWKMWETDLVIMHPQIGAGSIDEAFLVNLFYFVQLKETLGKVTVEELASLFGPVNTTIKFKALHEPRIDSLYHVLFLNKLLLGHIDEAFEVDKVNVLTSAEPISTHLPVIQGALKLKEKDLLTLTGLTKASDGSNYITDELTLEKLSFLYRHALLARLLKYKADDWKLLLKLLNKDLAVFTTPKEALTTVQQIQQVKTSGFTLDELNYVLAADTTAKAAVKEKDLTAFLMELRKGLKAIISTYDKNGPNYQFLQTVPATDIALNMLQDALKALMQTLNFTEEVANKILLVFSGELLTERTVASLPANYIPLTTLGMDGFSYDADNQILRFAGVLTTTQRTTLLSDPSLVAITGNPDYQQAVEEIFQAPRMLIKFFEHDFAAPLDMLPAAINFATQLDPALSNRIWYDAAFRQLHINGILTTAERNALLGLSADATYTAAINNLYSQPLLNAPEWLADTDLAFPLRDLAVPANEPAKEPGNGHQQGVGLPENNTGRSTRYRTVCRLCRFTRRYHCPPV